MKHRVSPPASGDGGRSESEVGGARDGLLPPHEASSGHGAPEPTPAAGHEPQEQELVGTPNVASAPTDGAQNVMLRDEPPSAHEPLRGAPNELFNHDHSGSRAPAYDARDVHSLNDVVGAPASKHELPHESSSRDTSGQIISNVAGGRDVALDRFNEASTEWRRLQDEMFPRGNNSNSLHRFNEATNEWRREDERSGLQQTSNRSSSTSALFDDYPTTSRQSTMKRRVPQARSNMSEADTDVDSDAASDVDVEEQAKKDYQTGRRKQVAQFKVLLRKIALAIFTTIDDETLQRNETDAILIIITFIKEVILAMFIALMCLSILMWLDYRFLLGLPIARSYRQAANALLTSDFDVLQEFEDNTGFRFMRMETYEDVVDHIYDLTNRTKLGERMMELRTKELIKHEKELAELIDKPSAIIAQLGLDRFKPDGKWGAKITCQGRVEALKKQYDTPRYQAMMSAMQNKGCKKSDEEMEEDRKLKVKEGELLKEWKANGKEDWCGECELDGKGETCYTKELLFAKMYAITTDKARAKVVVRDKRCTDTARRAEDKFVERLCETCIWGNKLTCKARVEYLLYTYKVSQRKAVLGAMEKEACVGPEK